MCGITGIFNLDSQSVDINILYKMTNQLVHRGPDGEGFYQHEMIGLGHRRLAIIDLSEAAKQPMQTRDGRFVLTYNGELYNYKELRLELQKLGCKFNSVSDSEVVLYAIAEWGIQAVSRFNGMFAFAMWDNELKKLILARDRHGVKPLYYTKVGNSFIFSSEIKGFFAFPGYSVSLNKEGLIEYLTFQNFFTDKTLFENVKLLPPASYLTIEANLNVNPSIKQYWDYSFAEPETPKDEQVYLEEFDFLFQNAVKRHIVSDVPVGCYLSGGMDSGSITMIASNHIRNLLTFTVGCDLNSASGMELSYDEREAAEYISYLAKSEHYEMVLKAGDMERAMFDLVWNLEEPRIGQSYPNYYASKLASKFVKVVLAGSGGDELFGGYPWRYYRAAINSSFSEYIDKYYAYWQRLISDVDAKEAFAPIWYEVSHVSTRDIFRKVFGAGESKIINPEDYVNHSLYFEAKTFLHGLLVMEDKLSMAHSLETRLPFLDNDLVDFSQRVPVKFKLGNLGQIIQLNENDPGPKTRKYFQKTNDGKLLLRKAMKKYIPQKILIQTKQGFSAPDASWFRGESIDYVRRTLLASNACIYEYLDRKWVEKIISDHVDGKVNNRLLIWSLLYVEVWCHIFLHNKHPMK